MGFSLPRQFQIRKLRNLVFSGETGVGVFRATGRPFIYAVMLSEMARAPETADVPPVGSLESAAAPMDGRAMTDEERQEMLTICPICSDIDAGVEAVLLRLWDGTAASIPGSER